MQNIQSIRAPHPNLAFSCEVRVGIFPRTIDTTLWFLKTVNAALAAEVAIITNIRSLDFLRLAPQYGQFNGLGRTLSQFRMTA